MLEESPSALPQYCLKGRKLGLSAMKTHLPDNVYPRVAKIEEKEQTHNLRLRAV